MHAELRAGLAQRGLGALEGQLQLARLDLDERRADADFAADFHEHPADDAGRFRADLGLIGRQQRAGEVDLPLDGHPLDLGGVDGHPSAGASALGPAAAAAACRRDDERGEGWSECQGRPPPQTEAAPVKGLVEKGKAGQAGRGHHGKSSGAAVGQRPRLGGGGNSMTYAAEPPDV